MSEGATSPRAADNAPARLTRGVAILVWAALAVVFFGAGYFLFYQREHANERQRAAQYSNNFQPESVQVECVQTPRTRTLRCVANLPGADGRESHAYADLQAQQEMAEWALAMLVASCAGLLVTFAGVLYVALTLQATRRAVAVAETANAGFAESSRRQLRAYVGIEGVNLVGIDGDGRATAKIRFKNFGQTPAYDFSYWSVIGWRPIPFSPEGFPAKPAKDVVEVTMNPGQGIDGSPLATLGAPSGAVQDHEAGKLGIVVYGAGSYRDVFEVTHHFKFGLHNSKGVQFPVLTHIPGKNLTD